MHFKTSSGFSWRDCVLCLGLLCPAYTLADTTSPDTAKEKITVVYLGSNHPAFWAKTRQFAREVADDLNITLRFKTADDRFEKLAAMKDLVAAPNKPDYLIFSYTLNTGSQMMALAHEAGIPFILINSDIPEQERKLTQYPREKFPDWLAHIYPNDETAGYLLADVLLKQAYAIAQQHNETIDEQHPLKVVGIGGPSNHLPATLRNRGLQRRVNTDSKATLKRLVKTEWEGSHDAVKTLFRSYNGVHVVWAAADNLAIETWEAAGRLGYMQGRDYVTGGIDWSTPGLDAVAQGHISASLGGHLMEAGWALILLYDYHHNMDFQKELGVVINTQLSIANSDNIQDLQALFKHNNWRHINYREFSKTWNPGLDAYRFNAEEMLRLFKRARSPEPLHQLPSS